METKGNLIVFEGIDGSGKSTQYKLICERLKKDGIEFHNIVFPRYGKESSALIRMYLNGEFGSDPNDVNAYTASTFYAVDRYASYVNDWKDFYENGGLVLADRYTTSNAVHQGAKILTHNLNSYFDWLADLEYVKFGLPKPELVVYLDTTLDLSIERILKREQETGIRTDIHENNRLYLSKCLRTADYACEHYGWKRISPFTPEQEEKSIEEKNDEIYHLILEAMQQSL